MTDPAIPPVPVIPKSWTIESAVTFGGEVVLFILGVLTAAHVTVPHSVSVEVSAIVGAAMAVAGIVTGRFGVVSKNSVTKARLAAVAAGIPVHEALSI